MDDGQFLPLRGVRRATGARCRQALGDKLDIFVTATALPLFVALQQKCHNLVEKS